MHPERKIRLAIVVSHPIQHFVPFYRALASDPRFELRVIYCARIGLQRYFDRDMGVEIAWAMDMLGGYDHVFLPEADRIGKTGFLAVDNPGVTEALARFRPDLVKVYGYSQLTGLRTLAWCRQRGIPIVMWSDSELLHERAGWRRYLKEVALRILYPLYSGFLTVGDNNEAYLRHYGVPQRKLFRTPFTIDEALYGTVRARQAEIRARTRAELGLPGECYVALFIGKLIPRKRPGDLVAATLRLAARGGRPVHAVFAGSGPLVDELGQAAAAAAGRCHFLGFVNVDRLPSIYAAADVLVHPSEKDPHPLVTCEAAFLGMPLVLSDRVGAIGPTDTARPGENTLVYRCADVDALAAAIARLAQDPGLHAAMSAASRRTARELDVRRSVQGCVDAAVALARS